MSQEKQSQLFFELGQIIKISAPSNPNVNEKIYLIDYLDDNLIKLINDTDFTKIELKINNGKLTDESIKLISILADPEEKGYARQNNLVPDNWITVEFGGDVPTIINGQITDIDEDEIEITIYETDKKIYIDFGGKGIPLDLPIINIRSFTPLQKEEEEKEKEKEEEITPLDEEEDDEDLELIIDSELINQNIQDLFISLDDIETSDEALSTIVEMVHVKEKHKRFGIETQTQDILDELLAEYPSNKRTRKVLNNIHIIIERFKQLRRNFSTFDKAGNTESIKIKGANYKPLINKLKELNQKLYWILPVARNSHKLIDMGEEDDQNDIEEIEFKFAVNTVMDAFQQFISNTVPDGQNKYNYLIQSLNPFFTPFLETSINNDVIIKQYVKENLDILINNYGDFLSTMYGMVPKIDNPIRSVQFVVDNYNLGLTRLENADIKNKNSKSIIVPQTSNDVVDLLGFLSLPEPYFSYSRINLNTASIYQRSNLHKFNYFYFKILKPGGILNEKTIKEGSEPEEGEIKEVPKDKKIFGYNTYYNFEERRKYVDREALNVKEEVYTNFLNNIIPKTRVLFELIKKYIKNGTSFIKIVEYLEPFLIYDDDISFKQYETIIEFMYEEIQKHIITLRKNKKEFIKFLRGNKTFFVSTILPKLIKRDYLDIFEKKFYNINDSLTTELSLKKLIDFDAGRLYNIGLSLSELTFNQPIDIEEKINEELKESENVIEEDKKDPKGNCKEYRLVKRYADLEDLVKDNNTPVFVDKKYDETPYDIGESWKRENSVLIASAEDNDLVIEELTTFLIKNNGIEKEKAKIDATAMVLGARAVHDGEYAILAIGDGDIKYYIRQDNIWKYDKTLSGKHIDEVNFCNLKQNCLKIKETCTNLDTSKEILKKNILNDIVRRFEDELRLSIDELKYELSKELTYRKQNLQSLKKLKIQKSIKKDLLQIKIANTLEEREIVISTYSTLRDAILSQNDIVKKFTDIKKFVTQYCRVANEDEDENWYYCIDSNVKLLPTFFQELAQGFFVGDYLLTLEQIHKERGEKSDDGDKWVDKHSGYYINHTDFDFSEGYDVNGYKNKSREVMEEDIADKFKASKLKDTKQEYSTVLAKLIEAFLGTFDKKLYISMKSQYNFIIKITMESMNKHAPDEKTYKELYAKQSKGGKNIKTYEKKRDEILLYSIVSAYIIAVQSSIPGVITKRAYGDCKKSFTGFPLDGNSDVTFIEYLSCMLFNLRRDDSPWNVIPKALTSKKRRRKNYDEVKTKFIGKIKQFMTDNILSIDEVSQKLNLKREWNKKNKTGEIIPAEFDVQQWTTFLPPLTPVTVTRLNNISHTFEKTLKTRIEEGNYDQFVHLWALYGKIVSYSFSIIESVQRAVNKEPLLLETKGGIPYLENACCNKGETKTNLYFSQKESSIQNHNKIIKTLTELYYKYKNSFKAPLFNVPINTKLLYPPVSKTFSKSTIYLAFIKYCKFNSGIELEDALKRVCIDNKCKFRKTESLENKMIAMEADSLNYSVESLNILLNIVNRENILYYDLDPPVTTEKLFLEETIKDLSNKDTLFICHSKLIGFLNKIVDRFNVSIQGKDDEIVHQFKNYLNDINREMSIKISEKMIEHKELTRHFKDLLVEYSPEGEVSSAKIKTKRKDFILNWDLRGDNTYMSREDETGFTIFRMIKELVINICKVYPNILLNKVDYTNRYVPKHWLKGSNKFSQKHKNDVIGFMLKDGEGFSKFYGNKNIEAVSKYVLKNNEDLLSLLNSIPFYAGILDDKDEMSSIFDGEILKKLGYYFLLCSFLIYISAFESGLKVDIVEEEEQDPEEDLSVLRGQQETLEKKTCELLSVYLKKIEEYKKLLNVSSETINTNVLKSKTKEKEGIVKRIGHLTDEEREIEDIMKNSSLGDWSLGRTKAIFEYDNKQYDKEREKMEKDALMEKRSGGLDDVSEFAGEIFNISNVIEQYEQDEVSRRIENEVYNLDGLADDDDFGDRDGDNQGDYN